MSEVIATDSKMNSKIENKKACIASIKKDSLGLYTEVMRRMDALIAKANNAPTPQVNKCLKRSQGALVEVELAKKQLCTIDAHLNKASGALTAAIFPDKS